MPVLRVSKPSGTNKGANAFNVAGYIGAAAAQSQSLDNKVTGGRVSQAVATAYNMGLATVSAVQDSILKKRKLNQEGSA